MAARKGGSKGGAKKGGAKRGKPTRTNSTKTPGNVDSPIPGRDTKGPAKMSDY